MKLLRTGALAFALFATAPGVLAEPASADPAFQRADGRPAAAPGLREFHFAGAPVSLSAHGPRSAIDTAQARNQFDESRAMQKFAPGYPQPAYVTVDVKLWF